MTEKVKTVTCKDCGKDFDRRSRSRRQRCEPCRKANQARKQRVQRDRNAKRPYDPSAPWHGTTYGYGSHACKCELCREAGLAYLRQWNQRPEVKARRLAAARNPELQARYALNRKAYRYGVDKETLAELIERGVCFACGDTPEDSLHIDHDHSCCPGQRACGECFRGLLCRRCNLTLGLLKDDRKRLTALIEYLDQWEAQKLSRFANTRQRDSIVDAAGFLANIEMILDGKWDG